MRLLHFGFRLVFIPILIASAIFSCSDSSTGPTVVLPQVTTASITNISSTSATTGGEVTSDGGGSIAARGACFGPTPAPTISDSKTTDGTGLGNFVSNLSGLAQGTNYYVRAYATNEEGTAYGEERSFFTEGNSTTGTVTDIDGNTYQTVKIGDQWWMAENLKVTHYRNGNPIVNLASNPSLCPTSTPLCASYDYNDGYIPAYGLLYNAHAVNDPRNIAPLGWHVPADSEWRTLIVFLGDSLVAGGKLKTIGTAQWQFPNTGATDEAGFGAIPAGGRIDCGSVPFTGLATVASFWTSTQYSGNFYNYERELHFDATKVYRNYHPQSSLKSVRCVMD